MKLLIDRTYEKHQTLGHAAVFDNTGKLVFQCKTLELPWRNNERSVSCIPEGVYRGKARTSAKYKDHIHITEVDGRSLILIHWGNYAGSKNPRTGHPDIRGCVLTGKAHLDIDGDGLRDITSSKKTFKKLMTFIGNGTIVEICGNGGKYSPDK